MFMGRGREGILRFNKQLNKRACTDRVAGQWLKFHQHGLQHLPITVLFIYRERHHISMMSLYIQQVMWQAIAFNATTV